MRFIKNSKTRAHNQQRRQFLEMLGKAGATSALLKAAPFAAGIFASRQAIAADVNKRVVFMYLPNGAPNGLWMPSSQTDMNLCTRAYKPVAQYCEFREVNMKDGGHGNTYNSLGAYGVAKNKQDTLDATLASENFPTSIHKIIRAGVQVGAAPSFTKEAGQQATHSKKSPLEFYKTLFSGDVQVNSNDESYKRSAEMNRLALKNLQKKLGVDEYRRFDAHLESINEIERGLAAANQPQDNGEACKSPAISSTQGHIVDDGKAISDIVVAALKCGLTNVSTIMVSDDQAGWFAGERGIPYGLTRTDLNHHNYSHSGNNTNTGNMVAILSEIPAYFIEQLAKNIGPDGQPLIDTTVFVQVTDMGDGDHGLADAPFMAASNMSGFGFKMARGDQQDFLAALPSRMGLKGDL